MLINCYFDSVEFATIADALNAHILLCNCLIESASNMGNISSENAYFLEKCGLRDLEENIASCQIYTIDNDETTDTCPLSPEHIATVIDSLAILARQAENDDWRTRQHARMLICYLSHTLASRLTLAFDNLDSQKQEIVSD